MKPSNIGTMSVFEPCLYVVHMSGYFDDCCFTGGECLKVSGDILVCNITLLR